MAYVGAGRYDGYFQKDLNIWDIAAGILIVKEAGGFISSIGDDKSPIETGNIIYANLILQGKENDLYIFKTKDGYEHGKVHP